MGSTTNGWSLLSIDESVVLTASLRRLLSAAAILLGIACTDDPAGPKQSAASGGTAAGSPGTGGTGGFGGGATGSASGSGGVSVGGGGAASGSGGANTDAGGEGGAGGAAGLAGGGASGAAGSPGAGGMTGKGRTGLKSAGCTKQPVGANSTSFTNHRIAIPACASCTVPDCPKDCIAPPFAPGGVNAQTAANGENFLDRDFTIQLPKDYDPSIAYPVFYGANGCGPKPPLMGAAFTVPGEDGAIKVGLQQVSLESVGSCFADGGIRCAPDIENVSACVNGPEIPYFLAVQGWVEANFCVDLGKEFVGGGSSGAWEAQLAGCGTASTLRGIYALAGGLREHRWACDGPIAAFMIASDNDTNNPVGPLKDLFVIEDSYGDAPARDELLLRNGCIGRDTAPYDPKFPACVKYTGCPATYPVVWCEFAGGSHNNPNYENVNYLNAVAPFLMGLPPAP